MVFSLPPGPDTNFAGGPHDHLQVWSFTSTHRT